MLFMNNPFPKYYVQVATVECVILILKTFWKMCFKLLEQLIYDIMGISPV